MTRRSSAPAIAVAALAALSLTACGGPGEAAAERSTPRPASFTAAPWAFEVAPAGDWLTSWTNDEIRIDIYQRGVVQASEDARWAWSDTDEPIFAAGDDVVVIQYVLTNLGAEDYITSNGEIDASFDFTGDDARSIPASTLSEAWEEFGYPDSGSIDHDKIYEEGLEVSETWDLPLAEGESAAWLEGFPYEAGAEVEFELAANVYHPENNDWDYGNWEFEATLTTELR